MFKNITDKRYKQLICLLIFVIFLYFSNIYLPFLNHFFSTKNYLNDFSITNFIIAVLILTTSLYLLYILPISPFIFSLSVLVKLLMLVPALVIFSSMSADYRIILSHTVFDLLLLLFGLIKFRTNTVIIRKDQQMILLIFALVILIIPFISIFGFDINWNLLLLKDISKSRLEVRNLNDINISYSLHWISKVCAPVLLLYSLINRKFFIGLLALSAIMYVYLVGGGHKSIFFSIFIYIYFFFFSNYYKKIFVFLLIVCVSLFISRVLTLNNKPGVEDLVVRRSFFDPAIQDTYYFEFFDNNHMYLSHSIFRPFIDNPYKIQPSFVIGTIYSHNPKDNAGNGIISDGFMNFGMPGVFISVLLSLMVLALFNSLNISPKFFGLYFMVIYGYTCTGILTNILTGGIFLIILISLFFLKDSNNFNSETTIADEKN